MKKTHFLNVNWYVGIVMIVFQHFKIYYNQIHFSIFTSDNSIRKFKTYFAEFVYNRFAIGFHNWIQIYVASFSFCKISDHISTFELQTERKN